MEIQRLSGRTRRLLRSAWLCRRAYTALVMSDPFLHYQSLINVQHFRKDDNQLRAVKELQKLYRRIDGYKPPIDFARKIKQVEKLLRNQGNQNPVVRYFSGAQDRSLVKQLSWEDELLNIDSPKGLMLSGSVGSGKSMLIDTLLPMKKRWHYNALMLELFARLNRDRDDEYILLKIAYELIEESPVLAIDEFQLGDPASARILKGILIYFWKMGGVLVATSNRMPEDLYSGSFQAEQFKSFTELLRTRCVVHDMRSTRDFRKEVEDQLAYYHTPGSPVPVEDVIAELLPAPSEAIIQVFSRTLRLERQSSEGVVYFTFKYICEQDFGPADYISIASRYHTVIIDDIPILTLNKKNEARRLISLIDALYETKCKLLIKAESTPDNLFFPDTSAGSGLGRADADSIASEAFSETFYDVTTPNRPNISSYKEASTTRQIPATTARPKVVVDFGKLNAFTGQDEQFAFKRAASRLYEMTSREWWERRARHEPNLQEERRWESAAVPMMTTRPVDAAASRTTGHEGLSPFRTHPEKPPRFAMEHFWNMVKRGGERKASDPNDWKK